MQLPFLKRWNVHGIFRRRSYLKGIFLQWALAYTLQYGKWKEIFQIYNSFGWLSFEKSNACSIITKNEDGKYLRIIDYKSSAKNIDLNEVYAGLQIQLLTYLDAVCKQEDLMPAGILYFSLLEQMVKSDKKITEEEIEQYNNIYKK